MIHSQKGKQSAVPTLTSHLVQRVRDRFWLQPQYCRNPLYIIFLPALPSRSALPCLFCFSLIFHALCAILWFKACKDFFWYFSLSTRLLGLLLCYASNPSVCCLFDHHVAFPHILGLFHSTGLPKAGLPRLCKVCMFWWSTPLPLLISSPLPHRQKL